MQDLICHFLSTSQEYYPTICRVVAGSVILPYGLMKLGFFDGVGIRATLQDFRNRKLPVVIAWLVIISQSLGSVGLILGIGSRLAALGAIIIFSGALLVHKKDGWMMNWYNTKKGEGIEYFVLLLTLLWIVLIYGGGAFSIDGYFSKIICLQK